MSMSQMTFKQEGGLFETENSRLQREADEYTKKLEHERRRLLILEDQLSQVKTEYAEKKSNIRKAMPSKEDNKKVMVALKNH